jgi:parallel beta-helix repeat protein
MEFRHRRSVEAGTRTFRALSALVLAAAPPDLTIKGKGKPIVDGAGAAITVVTVRGSQDIVLESGNPFERNRVTGSGGAGIHVLDAGNTFTRNRASKSGGFDLLDETTGGGNVCETNKFGTQPLPS